MNYFRKYIDIIDNISETKYTNYNNIPGPGDPETWPPPIKLTKYRKPEDKPYYPTNQKDIGAEIDSDRLDALNKFLNGIDFKISSDEGEAPNGEKYNTIWTYNGTKAQMDYKEQNFLKSEWGAKKLIDKNLTQNSDNNYTLTLYIKDNHKYGTWKPWKE